MKNVIAMLLAVAMCAAMLVGCGTTTAAPATTAAETTVAETATEAETEAATEETAAELQHAEYTVYNTTGATVTELYLYAVDAEDKGENLAGEGLADGENVVITRDATAEEAAAAVYVLEFTAEGMDTQKFETLHFEQAPISLKSVDAASGATPIAFAAPEA